MPDSLSTLLRAEADAAVATEPIPPVAALAQSRDHQPRRAPARLAPALAAVVVVGVALGSFALHRAVRQADPLIVPPPPHLGQIVPPLVVRDRLGAPPGHLNGRPVERADLLAIAPRRVDGLTLRTVGVIRPHATPDAKGRPRLDRCVYTYSDPGADALRGQCEWALSSTPQPPEAPVTVHIFGAPGKTWLQGTAPAGTAAVVLRAHGRTDIVVATADAGAAWDHRPYYVAWWPRRGTDVIAVDRAGHELARNRLPSDVPVRASKADPELGTVERPAAMFQNLSRVHFNGHQKPTRETIPSPKRVDVLARLRISDTVSVFVYGFGTDQLQCTGTYVQDYRADATVSGGSSSCGTGRPAPGVVTTAPINVSRSFVAGKGEPQEQLLSGSAPAGTTRLRLRSTTSHVDVPAYDGGTRWKHLAWFIAPWPSASTTMVTAYDAKGRPLATFVSRGMNPHAFDTDYLEAQARCIESHGIKVTRHPQPGSAPAYSYSFGTRSQAEATAISNECEDVAARATGTS